MSKIIFQKQQLTIQYYIARWGYAGLDGVEIDRSGSFKTNVQNYRWMLQLDKTTQLVQPTKHQFEVARELKNKTITQVREIIRSFNK